MSPAVHRIKGLIALALVLFAVSSVSLHCSATAAQLDPPPAAAPLPNLTVSPTFMPTPTETLTTTPMPTKTMTPTLTATWMPTDTPTLSPTETWTPSPTDLPAPTDTQVSYAVSSARVPILMYHHIVVPPPDADPVRVDLSVPPEVFEAEIKFLSDQGFHTIHLTDLVNHLKSDEPLPPKPIIITFDDGYDDNYINAFPALKDYGFVGTFFVISGRADDSRPGYLTWPQIEEMAANGMEIGSHSLDHRFNLGEMPFSIQWAEIKPSYDAIAQHLPTQAPVFAYPSGSYNTTTLSILKQLGYIAAVTTRQSVTQHAAAPLELRRVRIRGEWSVGEFVFWLNYWVSGL